MLNRGDMFETSLIAAGEFTWLDRKVLRRELTEDRDKAGMNVRQQRADEAAASYRDAISQKAERREGINERSDRIRRQQEERLRAQAEAYRKRLQGFLREELRD